MVDLEVVLRLGRGAAQRLAVQGPLPGPPEAARPRSGTEPGTRPGS